MQTFISTRRKKREGLVMRAFQKGYIGDCEIDNRCVRSATHDGFSDENGFVTREVLEFVRESASGGAALFITGHAFVSKEGQASPRQLSVATDAAIPGLTQLSRSIKKEGARAFLQLAHAGSQARQKISGAEPIGPSDFFQDDERVGRGASLADITLIIEAFTRAAERAEASGFDGIQIHAAHGYLLSQFLSPHYNKRTDAYGSALEKRMRLLCEVVESIRRAVLKTFPIIVKLNVEDFLSDGFTQDEMLIVSRALATRGVNALELSGGTPFSEPNTPIRKGDLDLLGEVFYKDAAKRLRPLIDIPLILVGGVRSPQSVEMILAEGLADFVALSRPLIREPFLIKEWKNGRTERATCVSCNLCFRPLMTGKGLYCVVEKKKKNQ